MRSEKINLLGFVEPGLHRIGDDHAGFVLCARIELGEIAHDRQMRRSILRHIADERRIVTTDLAIENAHLPRFIG